jgi:hypothetical protein
LEVNGMADVSRYADLSGHPDLVEMRERFERVSTTGQAVAIDGLVLLAGTWLAISPWVIGFNATAPRVTVNNLILGLAVAVLGLGLTMTPARMYRLSWAMVALGVWEVISQWVIQRSASSVGIVVNNVVTGGITALLGLGAVVLLMSAARPHRGA